MNRDADLAADCRRLERKLKQVTEERNSWKRWCEEAEAKLAALEPEPLAVVEGWLLNGDIASKKLTGLEAHGVWVYGDFYGKLPVTLFITEGHRDA